MGPAGAPGFDTGVQVHRLELRRADLMLVAKVLAHANELDGVPADLAKDTGASHLRVPGARRLHGKATTREG